MHIGEKIKQRRIELGMSQRELARRMEYNGNSTLNRIENGTVEVTQTKLLQFAQALNVSVTYLMGVEENEQTNMDNPITNEEKILLELYRNIAEDKKEIVLKMLQVAVEKE